jgi:hypothetical protein
LVRAAKANVILTPPGDEPDSGRIFWVKFFLQAMAAGHETPAVATQ